MGIIGTILIGFIIGLVARALMPGKDPSGFIITVILGIVGSFVGQQLGLFLNFYGPDEPAGFLMSVIGALIVLFIYHRLSGSGSTTKD